VSVTHEIGRFARSLGIVAIFTMVGPLVVAAVFGFFVLAIGIQVVQLMLEFFELEALRPWLSIAFSLLLFFGLVAAVPGAAVAGVTFAVAAIYLGMNSLWTALVVAAIMVAGIVILGFFFSPSESSAFFLPSLQGMRQGFWLALFLFVPAAIAASLCWIFSRPLHRMS
jgi:hypothetical protein